MEVLVKYEMKKTYCDRCHVYNDEVLIFRKYWFLNIKLCQSCISKLFRAFIKGK